MLDFQAIKADADFSGGKLSSDVDRIVCNTQVITGALTGPGVKKMCDQIAFFHSAVPENKSRLVSSNFSIKRLS